MLGVNAAEGSQRETAVAFRMRGEMHFKEERHTKSFSYRWKQPKRRGKSEERRTY